MKSVWKSSGLEARFRFLMTGSRMIEQSRVLAHFCGNRNLMKAEESRVPLPEGSVSPRAQSLPAASHIVPQSDPRHACFFHIRRYGSAPGHSRVVKDRRFAELKDVDIAHFRQILGDKGVVVDSDELKVANTDWMNKYEGHSQLLLRPRTTQQVSEILQYCYAGRLAVVPQGGNTGLVGGSVPVFDEVILNLGAMNKILNFDEASGILVCEAGCILESLDNYVGSRGYVMPLDLGAKGSCQIGGNVSTNAGGLRLLRYGSLHGNVLGLEVVLADGTVLDLLGTLRKDNTGYDLKQLFIGGEGTLGVVTKVSIITPPKLASTNVAFLACEDYVSCQKTFAQAKLQLGEILSAFEFLDRYALDVVLKHLDGTRDPLPDSKQHFYLLVETTGSNQLHDKEKLDAFLESAIEQGLITDGAVAQDISQAASFWKVREGVAEAMGKGGAVYKYDLSIPLKDLYTLVEDMRSRLKDSATVVGYGHMGDGNLHLNIMAPKYDNELLAQIEPYVYEWTAAAKGSISAEHGLGFMKAKAIHYSKSTAAVQVMEGFKKLLDPRGILNPYKVLPSPSESHVISEAT
ncbi:(R)-2-hydroxyglutarate---pyruvate transhydrogenase [Marchantia polymorpha subsp. ruderalis]|uniref:D-2-hydroxyglutarate dehydrogenase n=4 Tax=Marchantia polymorpha TaxID=3197 RepID=A0AAF6AKZ4_MARPO|nr:hypothetical protein MARPO_0113s0062 [Marchantia polymorpha]BBM97114.1 hypothetical protein Mp_1g03130 [Marchantia polymorpha subsp. ruderalis]|eukprot:PTQ31339.1 hypothetical protein MARPO_0113s0062 [Marchantia polymorpha]